MYGQRSKATHRASYSHVSDREDLSQWIAWMLQSMVALSCQGITTPDEATKLLRRRTGDGPRPTVKCAIEAARRALASLDQWLKGIG
jgi:hypothetical protein